MRGTESHSAPGGDPPGERAGGELRLYLLGRFEVVRASAPIPAHAWRRRRPADLLKLTALSPGHALPRESAIEALWPDKDLASGANNLHRALYDLRQILGGRFVDIDRGLVRLRPGVWVDVDAFERASEQGGPEGFTQAVALYRGDLSPEDLESPWLHARRAALRARFGDAALPLARAAAQGGDAQLAIPLLRRALDVTPGEEEAHRLLVTLLAESGRRAEAVRQCDASARALRGAGLAPSDELRQLRAAVLRGELGQGRAPPIVDGARRAARRLLGTTDPPPVRGRAALLLLLEALVEQGSGTVVLLGERGVGKTRLAVEGARLAQARGAAVVCGIAGLEPGTPYALFHDALREEARVSPALADPLAHGPLDRAGVGIGIGIGGEAVRLALFDGVERALDSIADRRPLFLLLDDLHEADESSLNLLHLLARHARERRLMIVATCAEEAIHAGTPIQMALAHLDCGRLARGVRVSRLGLAGTRAQVADLLDEPPAEATVEEIYRVTDGSPMLVEEVVRARRESPQGLVPSDPSAAIRGRVARLGEGPETLLAAAAAAGARFAFEPVRAVCGLPADEAADALEACLEARILDADGGGYRFHHALVRDAVYAGLAPARRTALHAALADLLEARGGGDEPHSGLLAWHRRRAGQDAAALRHLLGAGHRAAARAGLREALAFFAEAQDLLAPPGAASPAERLELLDALGRVQLGLGELGGAARAFGEAARLEDASGLVPDAALRVRAHRLAALALAAGGHLRAAHAELDDGLAAASWQRPLVPSLSEGEPSCGRGLRQAQPERCAGSDARADGVAPLLHLRAQLLWHEGRPEEARAAARACAGAAAAAGDADLRARGEDLAALAAAAAGEPLAAPADRTGAAERRRQDDAPEHPVDVHLVLWARDLLAAGAGAVGRLAALLGERARMREAPEVVAAARTGEGLAAVAGAEPDLADAALREALAGHRAAGSAIGEALTLERLGALLTQRGRLDEALDVVDEGIVVAERASLRRHALTLLHATEARNRLAAGALHAAEAAVREASETAARHGECVVCDAAFRPEAVRVLVARGRVADAAAEAAALEEIARQRGGAPLEAVARATRARVLAAEGRKDEALLALAAARAAFLAAGLRYEAARCARLEARLRGPGAALPDEVRALDPLVLVDADA